jgi:acyl transferase domain-containing protein/acyl carrier protein
MPRPAIAVVGVACRFPGARDYRAFWDNLAAGRESAGETPPGRDGLTGRLLGNLDRFDASFFSISPREARAMDPQQRLLLEETWHAIEDAGLPLDALRRKRTGVFIGAMTSDFLQDAAAAGTAPDSYAALGAYHCILANRLSHVFGFTGPSAAVDAGHAASLVALHQAMQSLASGEVDYAIVGGVNVILNNWKAASFAKARMLSPDRQCRPFDASANGYVPAEGVGVVVLQPLAAARRDRQQVRAVLRGSAVNHSGATASITAPDAGAQRRVIDEAHDRAGIAAETVTYVEAHGTGTPAGDPVEIEALRQVFGRRKRRAACVVGSVKSNIGHLEAASGMAGLIKVILMMAHRHVPATVNIRALNPALPLAGSGLRIATEAQPWKPASAAAPLRAGVSSFGFGGVNAHVVVDAPAAVARTRPSKAAHWFELSAKTAGALMRLRDEWRAFAQQPEFRGLALADICATLATRESFPYRWGVEVRTTRELTARLGEAIATPIPGSSTTRMLAPAQRGRRIALPVYPFESGASVVAAPAVAQVVSPDIAAQVRSVLARILQCDASSIGDADRFRETLGVDSFASVEIVEALEPTFGTLSRTLLFEHHTVADLAAYLSQREQGPVRDAQPAPTQVRTQKPSPSTGIAIVGLAGRFPKSRTVDELWTHLVAGESCITGVPAGRWSRERIDTSGRDPDRAYTEWGGFLDDYDAFDPLFFRISPKQAEQMDPQQRIFLETAWAAVEDAGYTPASLPRDTGVFAGVSGNSYGLWAASAAGPVHTPDTDLSDVANRVSYSLDLRGPSLSVDTACSASLTALHLAVQSLQRGECGAALVGGVNLTLHPNRVLQFCRKEMLLHGKDCHPFGAGPGGFVDGEGVCVVLLKPLAAATADGDHIYAVVKGTAVNSEGRTSGYTVPSPERQAQLVRQALQAADVDARTISYVEAHGTGTRLGDPIEIEGLTKAYRADTADSGFCAIGSLKSNIGHLIAAAGMAGVAKVLLQLKHRTLVPSLHADTLNPFIDFPSTPFSVQRELAEWRAAEGQPRRAGVSSFGSGGANAHVILEEYVDRRPASRNPDTPVLVHLSARSGDRLRVQATQLAAFLERPEHARVAIADVAYTLRIGREAMASAETFAAVSIADLARQLREYADGGSTPVVGDDAVEAEGRRISLPTYPFLRQRYWLPLSASIAPASTATTLFYAPHWREAAAMPPGTVAARVVRDSDDLSALDPQDSTIVIVAGGAAQALPRAIALAGTLTRQSVRRQVVYAYTGSDPRHRAVEALWHAAQLEQPSLTCRVVECEPGADVAALARAECGSDATFIRYQRGVRLVRVLEPFEPNGTPVAVRADGAYVITGGAGGIGVAMAMHLADRGARHIALIGRSPADRVASQIEAITARGAEVWYAQADVTVADQVERALAGARRRFGVLRGVIHAAGIKHDGRLQAVSREAALAETAIKVDGAIHLDEATRGDALDFFAMCSSVAAILHGDGAAAYAAANAFLDHFAAARAATRPGRTVSINWPFWQDGGMQVPASAVEMMRRESGLEPMPTAAALRAWDAVIAADHAQCAVLYGDAARIRAAMTRRYPVAPAVTASMPATGSGLSSWITALAAEEIGVNPREMDGATELANYGFDSVNMRQLLGRLEERFGTLPKSLLLECPTIDALSQWLSSNHAVSARPAEALPARAQSAPAAAEPIAIVGVHGRYPMAGDLDEFWANLASGRDCITDVPASRWNAAALFDPNPARAADGRIYCTRGGFLDGVELFDPLRFELTPIEARQMHPEERLLLESAWLSLEDAGYRRDDLRGRRIGVFVGVNALTYPLLALDEWRAGGNVSLDTSYYPLPNRISYFFDWTGPSLPIDTGCSSSLVAIHQACESIRSGSSDAAIAGGVNLYLHPSRYWSLCRDRLLTTAPEARLFAQNGDGFMPGEGVGTVYLKPLSHALRDGDTIHGVIRASSVAHKGRSQGFFAASPGSQAALLKDVLHQAQIDPASVSYIEVQSTGAEMADSAEWRALASAYGAATHCAIGSVKPNIGHLEAAAGMAQLTRVLLQMRHGRLAPVLSARDRNPDVALAGGPFYIPEQGAAWHGPRRAAITSVAAGGTTAHLIVDDYPAPRSARVLTPTVFERRRCWIREPEPAVVDAVAVPTGEAPGVVADYYNRMTDALADTLGVEEEMYVLFAPFAERVPGFSWLKAFFDPASGRDQIDLMLRKQKELKAALYRRVDFSRVRRVCDIGCGLATDLMSLARMHPHLRGEGFTITPRQAQVGAERIRKAGLQDRVTVHCADSTARPFPGMFDLFIGFEVVFHIENKDALFANIAAHLNEGGQVVLADGVTNTVTEIDMPHLGQFTATTPQFSRVLARHRLRIDDCVDSSREIGNFLYDADFEANLAATNAKHPALAAVEHEHRCWDSFGKTLTQGLVRYLLFSIGKAPAGETEDAIARHNEQRINDATPYSKLSITPASAVSATARPTAAAVEARILELAARTLEIESSRIDVDARFVDYGVGSFQGLVLLEAVNRDLGLRLKLPVLYDYSSIRDLATHIAQSHGEAVTLPVAAAVTAPVAPRAAASSDVAIVGLAARFPGAGDADAFWANLRDGVDSIGEIPPSRFDAARTFDADPSAPGRSYSKWAGLISGVDEFDAEFFKISRHEAELMDPQQRLFLQACWTALDDAGLAGATLAAQRCGVYAGVMGSDYAMLLRDAGLTPDAHTLLGNDDAVLASRISYFLNLKGPAFTVKTACSSSLVAVHLACRALAAGEADVMLAGGVTLYLHPDPFVMMSKAGMLSPTGRCRPFDDGADGIAVGDGCGVVVLKRLSDALASGDRIYGVIKGSAVNQDGKTNGMTAPSMEAQAALEREVYAAARINPDTIDYIEAHGTGTKLGDPIEIAALTKAFRAATDRRQFCGIGSVKSNIGHTTAAAGVAGLIKVLLAMKHGAIPPTLHVSTTNRHVDFEDSPFFVERSLRAWPASSDRPRRAAISAFAYNGTNCHLVVEQAPVGVAIDASTARPRPSHVFAKERYWIPGSQEKAAAATSAVRCLEPVWRDAPHSGVPWTGPIAIAGACDPLTSAAGCVPFETAQPADAIVHAGGFESAVTLARSLAGSRHPVQVLSVYADGDLRGAALSGFARTVMRELPHVQWRTVGVSDWIGIADRVRAELASADAVDVRYDGDRRLVRDLDEVRLTAGQPAIRAGGLYLITGGGGGIGRILSAHLAAAGARVVTCGRSPSSAAGYFQADVTRRADVESLMARLAERYGPLSGVIHAAGVIDDALLSSGKAMARLQAVVAAKMDGAVLLDEATRRQPLDLFALCSSAAGILGNVGQTDYAYANAFLDRFAEWRETQRVAGQRVGRSVSIAWPLWEDGGMKVTFAVRQRLMDDFGMSPLSTADGLATWDAAIGSAGASVIVPCGDAHRYRVAFALRQPAPTRAFHEVPADVPAGETARADTERVIREFVAEHLGADADRIDPAVPFEDYGFDSLMIQSFNHKMEKRLGSFSKTVMFECRTIAELADYVVRHHGGALAAPVAAMTAAIAAPAVVPAAIEADAIAIIGVSGRYPQAPTLDEFWANLASGRDCVGETPRDRWEPADYGDQIYCSQGAFLEGADRFDPLFFGISPRDAEKMDPQERQFLEVAWATLEDAGYTRQAIGRNVGVFVGVTTATYALWGPDAWRGGETAIPESMPWSIPNRVSYFFDFHGPSLPVDTACSSSLTAIHMACESLRKGECETALAGGVNLYLHPAKYVQLCQLTMLSKSGRCRSFGAGGDGFVPGEGVGAVLLKPLAKAEADGDAIYGVIRGSAISHGGKTNGYTVPNPQAHGELILAALGHARVNPRTISYVEAHGTGTALGDPVEIAGLTKAYAPFSADKQFCAVGSVKSNIGHLEAAAGIAGLTKILLQMRHGQLAPSLHAATPNPNIDFAASPFYVQQSKADWPMPRRAAISSFGAGGANAHLILEANEAAPRAVASRPGPFVFPLSARSADVLQAAAQRLFDYLGVHSELAAEDVAFTLQEGRESFVERLAIVADDLHECRAALAAFGRGETPARAYRGGKSAPAIVRSDSADGDANALARQFAAGDTVDWAPLQEGRRPRRVSLPSYAFNGKRYWLTIPPAPEGATLHPLLDRNTSTLGQTRFTTRLSGREFCLTDHVVSGRKVLPGVAYLEMARAAAALAGSREPVRLSAIAWIRPLVVDEAACEVDVHLRDASGGALAFDVSAGGVLHAQGQIHFETRLSAVRHDVAAIQQRCQQRMSGVEFYRLAAEQGFAYGPAFQSLQMLCSSETEALARLELPVSQRRHAASYVLHPSLLDGALQSVAGLRPTGSGEPSMPLALSAIEIYGPVPRSCFAYAIVNGGGYDIHLLDDAGDAMVLLQGVSLRRVGASAGTGMLEVLRRLESGDLDLTEARRLIDVTRG